MYKWDLQEDGGIVVYYINTYGNMEFQKYGMLKRLGGGVSRKAENIF